MKDEINNSPEWVTDGKVNEVAFATFFLKAHEMTCVNGILFDEDGIVTDIHILEQVILEMIAPYVTSNMPRRIAQIMDTIRLMCSCSHIPTPDDTINVSNGTLYTDGSFSSRKNICSNRLPVGYNPEAPEPEKWLDFLDSLLYPEDPSGIHGVLPYSY